MQEPPNYYQILGLEARQHAAFISYQEVKRSYKRALLLHHPDKKSTAADVLGPASSATVDDIALAFKTLSEPELRAEYDRWLRSVEAGETIDKRPHHTGLETVDLDDLDYDSGTSSWSRSCRCGDEKGFLVTESELEKNLEDGELIVGCKGCSLWLLVLFGVED